MASPRELEWFRVLASSFALGGLWYGVGQESVSFLQNRVASMRVRAWWGALFVHLLDVAALNCTVPWTFAGFLQVAKTTSTETMT